jgi:hypothetical protein
MKYLAILACTLVSCKTVQSQTSLESAQGIWKEQIEDFESYIVIDNHNWYSITVLDGEVDVSLDWFGFIDSKPQETLNPKGLGGAGRYLVFLAYRKSISSYDESLDVNYYDFYDYDLGSSSFTYYAGDPVSLTRLDELPKEISEQFILQKVNLAYFEELQR